MGDHKFVPEADALEQALPPIDTDPELLEVEDLPEIGFEAPEADVLDQRLAAGDEDDEDDFR